MSQKIELLPCPFCGGKAQLLHEHRGITYSYVICMKCAAQTDIFQISTEHSSDEKAVAAWNRRAEEPE